MIPSKLRTHRQEEFSCGYESLARQALGPGRLARLLAQARGGSLDRALIAGFDPAGSRLMAARALTLGSSRTRASLAAGLERLLEAAQGPPSMRRVRPRSDAVVANALELRAVAAALRSSSPLYARGVAVIDELLSDGTGPAYRGDADALARRLGEARAAMEGNEASGGPHTTPLQPAPNWRHQVHLHRPPRPQGGTP